MLASLASRAMRRARPFRVVQRSLSSTELAAPVSVKSRQVVQAKDALQDPQARSDAFDGVRREVYAGRTAKIFMPAKCTTSSGKNVMVKWRMIFPTPERWTNNLMGWTSTRDPLSNMSVDFNSLDQAVSYAESLGCNVVVHQPKAYRLKPKSYADNFVWKGPKMNKAPPAGADAKGGK